MILLGCVTIVIGVVSFFFLIDSPKAAALKLNAEQEILVEERTRDNATVRTTEIKTEQIWEAVKEIRFWCFGFACLLINLQNGAMTIYNGQITASFGFDVRNTAPFHNEMTLTIYVAITIYAAECRCRWFHHLVYRYRCYKCPKDATNNLLCMWFNGRKHHWHDSSPRDPSDTR